MKRYREVRCGARIDSVFPKSTGQTTKSSLMEHYYCINATSADSFMKLSKVNETSCLSDGGHPRALRKEVRKKDCGQSMCQTRLTVPTGVSLHSLGVFQSLYIWWGQLASRDWVVVVWAISLARLNILVEFVEKRRHEACLETSTDRSPFFSFLAVGSESFFSALKVRGA